MFELRVCIDVPDLDEGIAFYTRALGLTVGRRLGPHWVELRGGSAPIDLLGKAAGTHPIPNAPFERAYARHWTPVHLDVVVKDLDAAVKQATEAGATLDRGIRDEKWGRMANLADPFGNGLCLLEFRGRGYDALL
jgi:catechol 2,3-dioxygenase-like lactoylglutathione lyase family enzyme